MVLVFSSTDVEVSKVTVSSVSLVAESLAALVAPSVSSFEGVSLEVGVFDEGPPLEEDDVEGAAVEETIDGAEEGPG